MKRLLIISLFCLLNINLKNDIKNNNAIILHNEKVPQEKYNYFFVDLEKEYKKEKSISEFKNDNTISIKDTYVIKENTYVSSNGNKINYLT